MREKWVVSAKKDDFKKIGQMYGIDQVIARLIRNRDVTGEENIRRYLFGTIKEMHSPWLLKDMRKSVEIIRTKVLEQKKIRIIGDYDIDGVTATFILLKGLKRIGADVDTYIPDRIADGYGMNIHLVEKAYMDKVDTILTCDNGISALDEIVYAKEKGLTVIVTDHHEIPYVTEGEKKRFTLPLADGIINPKQMDCPYPQKNICGAMVAFKLVIALYECFGIPETELEEYYELAAIATVGDVMDLQGENRIVVKEGLRRLQYTRNLGLQALLEVNNLQDSRITAYHIGFVLGPCINASGRLDTALRSLKLLESKSYDEAKKLAGDLLALNISRKAMTEEGKEKAFEILETTGQKEDSVLIVYMPECHESLAGIIAGRIREKYHKPSFVLTDSAEGVKGSGRSIEAYSMYEELVKCADLLERFGGHPMAAGLSLKQENINKFRERMNQKCTLKDEDFIPKVVIDVPMPFSYISRALIEQLSFIEPFGKGNTKPLFAQKNLKVLNSAIIGKNHNVLKMLLADEMGNTIEAVYFGEVKEFKSRIETEKPINITYYPEINSYQGREKIQIIVQNYC